MDIGAVLNSNKIDMKMIDGYRCGLKLKQIDMKMINQYISVSQTKKKTDMKITDQYRCNPNSNKTKRDRS